ncbi:MAG: DUF1015 domain-containing protein [Gemmatimonadetes bacterium]|nr:DUF1015 domain-containing protein [Gemmatimonadota bacterium]
MTDESLPSLVAPFVGERYGDTARMRDLIAPPYDVISPRQREGYMKHHEHNIVRLILPEGNGDRYERAAATLDSWRAAGVLRRDDAPSVYVVRQAFHTPDGDAHVRTGVIAAVAVEPYSMGRVKPHEKTHKGPIEDRLALTRSTRAMFEALLMMARDEGRELQDRLAAVTRIDPHVRATLDGVDITMWRVGEAGATDIADAASRQDALYIADGHHRYETAGIYRDETPAADRTLALIVPLEDPGLVVLPTHRLVRGAPIDEAALRRSVGERFEVSRLDSPGDVQAELTGADPGSTVCVVSLPGPEFFGVRLKRDADLSDLPFHDQPSVLALDVAKIDRLIVDQLVTESGGGRSLGYEASDGMVIEAVISGGAAAGVLMNPTGLEQVLAVADAGAFMPQKSTYFAPKAPSGLVILGW